MDRIAKAEAYFYKKKILLCSTSLTDAGFRIIKNVDVRESDETNLVLGESVLRSISDSDGPVVKAPRPTEYPQLLKYLANAAGAKSFRAFEISASLVAVVVPNPGNIMFVPHQNLIKKKRTFWPIQDKARQVEDSDRELIGWALIQAFSFCE